MGPLRGIQAGLKIVMAMGRSRPTVQLRRRLTRIRNEILGISWLRVTNRNIQIESPSNFHDRRLKSAIPAIGLLAKANLISNGAGVPRSSDTSFLLLCSFFVFLFPPRLAVLVIPIFFPERQVFRCTLFLNSVLSALLQPHLCRASLTSVTYLAAPLPRCTAIKHSLDLVSYFRIVSKTTYPVSMIRFP
jgi:hypothetical protein